MTAGSVWRGSLLSQPTVSRELSRMEQLLGYALFERVQGRLRANARALLLWDEVQRNWQGLERVIERAVELGQAQGTHISVLSMPAADRALPGALARLQAQHGAVAVSVATQGTFVAGVDGGAALRSGSV